MDSRFGVRARAAFKSACSSRTGRAIRLRWRGRLRTRPLRRGRRMRCAFPARPRSRLRVSPPASASPTYRTPPSGTARAAPGRSGCPRICSIYARAKNKRQLDAANRLKGQRVFALRANFGVTSALWRTAQKLGGLEYRSDGQENAVPHHKADRRKHQQRPFQWPAPVRIVCVAISPNASVWEVDGGSRHVFFQFGRRQHACRSENSPTRRIAARFPDIGLRSRKCVSVVGKRLRASAGSRLGTAPADFACVVKPHCCSCARSIR